MAAPTTGYSLRGAPPTSSNPPHLKIPDPIPHGDLDAFTVEHWFYLDSLSQSGGALANMEPGASFDERGYNFYFRSTAGGEFSFTRYGESLRVGTPLVGEWAHVAWIYNGDGTGEVFQNGVSLGSGSLGGSSNYIPSCGYWHSRCNGDVPPIDGKIARVRFWNKALTAQEITDSMNKERYPTGTPDLLAEYGLESNHVFEEPNLFQARAELPENEQNSALSISGTVRDETGGLVETTVLLFRKNSGRLIEETKKQQR